MRSIARIVSIFAIGMGIQAKKREDSYLHKGLRRKLLQALQEKGISDSAVLAAMEFIPRHFFLDPAFERFAYEDTAFSIVADQTISQPFTVATQSSLLNVQKYDKILEVGTGSAYQACVLARLGANVYTIERQKDLYDYNNSFFYLKEFHNIKRFYGDGFKGLPSYAPFDKIIITAAAPHIPQELIAQLKVGGIMVLPLDDEHGASQIMTVVTKNIEGIEQERIGTFSFVPMLKGKSN